MLPQQGRSSTLCASSFCSHLPRRVLRHLILGHELGVGARVLDTGRDGGRLVRFLRELRLEARSWPDEWPGGLSRGMRQRVGCPGENELPFEELSREAPFDLIVLRDLPVLAGSLLSREALATTGELLACLRPGGALVLIGRRDPDSGRAMGQHEASCYQELLSVFPGQCRTVQFPDGFLQTDPWKWLSRRQPRYLMASLRLPRIPLSRRQWLSAAEAAAAVGESCCRGLRRIGPQSDAA